jgi:hypothetical protein
LITGPEIFILKIVAPCIIAIKKTQVPKLFKPHVIIINGGKII